MSRLIAGAGLAALLAVVAGAGTLEGDWSSKIAVASIILSAVCYFSYHFLLNRYGFGSVTIKLVEVFLPIILGGIAFVIAAKLMRVSELEQAFGTIKRKLAR